jgi:thiol-disulfide isomerase/thioredoxin
VVAICIVMLAAACASVQSPGGDVRDFKLNLYQAGDTLESSDGSFAQLFRYGKPVVLNFWAGNCPPCQAEMPAFQRVADEYRGEVLVIGIDVGTFTGLGDHDAARSLLQDLRIRYAAGYGVDATPVRAYGLRSMPTTLLFTPKGKLVKAYPGMLLEDGLIRGVTDLIAASRV